MTIAPTLNVDDVARVACGSLGSDTSIVKILRVFAIRVAAASINPLAGVSNRELRSRLMHNHSLTT